MMGTRGSLPAQSGTRPSTIEAVDRLGPERIEDKVRGVNP